MPHHFERSMPHDSKKMFALVADIEAYPSFVPFCKSLAIIKRTKNGSHAFLEAKMQITFQTLEKCFKSVIDLDQKNLLVTIRLLKEKAAPLAQLEAQWSFPALKSGKSTNVCLLLEAQADHFAKNWFLQILVKQFGKTFMDAFEKRANVIYSNKT